MAKGMTEAELAVALSAAISIADGYGSSDFQEMRRKALDYYYGRPMGNEQLGCSAIVSTDVADMIEAVVAGILPAFETDNVIEFEALSDEDAEQVSAESDAVNYFIMEENNGYIFLQEALRDALLLRNGFTKTWIDERVTVTTDHYAGLSDIEFFELTNTPSEDSNTVIEFGEATAESDGIAVSAKYTTTERKLKVAAVDPTRFFYSTGYDTTDLTDIPLCGELIYYTRSELIEMGYKRSIVDALNAVDMNTASDNDARNQDQSSQLMQSQERSQDAIECFEALYRVDFDGDGISELRRILLADETILENEPHDFINYATGTGFLQPHRITGLSLYDKLKTVQDTKTATLRQYLDNFQNGNQGRLGYRKGNVNLDDLTDPRPSGVVGATDPTDIWALPTMDIGGSAQALLAYMDQVRSARGGASLDLQSAEAQIMGETAQGIERQYSVREQLAALMCRTLAETLIAQTYRNVHTALRLSGQAELVFKNREGFATTNPSEWPERNKVNVKSGLSFGERSKKVAALGSILQQQAMMLQTGQAGVMVDLNGYHSALIDQAKAAGIDNPEKYYLDPQSPQSQQAAQIQMQQQQQQQAAQAQMQQQQAQMLKALEDQKLMLDKYKHDTELQFDYWKERLDAEVEEAKIMGKATTDLELQKNAMNSPESPEAVVDV